VTARAFWEGSAQWDAHRAIFDSEGVRDQATRDDAFEQAGLEDAEFLARFLRPEMRVLDIGCGIGRVMRPLAPLCSEIVGIDISERMIEQGRQYLANTSNARLLRTSGSDLSALEDGSVDFVYSLIVLIHIDKRNAYRTFRELARVLSAGGQAFLQFENIESPEGLAEFQRVVGLEQEYPLEFYTEAELRSLLPSVGLGVLSVSREREFLFVHAVKGVAADWTDALRDGLHTSQLDVSGLFAAQSATLGDEGALSVVIENQLERAHNLLGGISLRTETDGGQGELYFAAEAVLRLEAGAQARVEVRTHGERGAQILCDGELAPCQRSWTGSAPTPARALLGISLLPAGYAENELFPELGYTHSLELG